MNRVRDKIENESHPEYSLTKKGRRLIKEEQFMKRLSEQEKKAYEECMALLQGITDNGGIEEACELLESYASDPKEEDEIREQ